MEALAKKFRGVAQFVFIYTREAHPHEAAPVNTPQERRQRAAAFQRALGGQRLVLVDEFGAASVQERYRATAHAMYVVSSDGRIAAKTQMIDPPTVDQFLKTWLPVRRAPVRGPAS